MPADHRAPAHPRTPAPSAAAAPAPAPAPAPGEITRRGLLRVGGLAVLGASAAAASLLPAESAQALDANAWGGFENGRIPLSALTIVDFPGVVAGQTPGGPHVDHVYLEPRAASALLSMLRTYRDMTGMYLDVIEGYRPFANQEYWWDHYGHDPRFAAVPGTSVHGWGKAVDFTDELLTDNKVAWLHAYGPDFNYHPISTERWHFNYVAPSPDLAIGMDPPR